MHDVRKRLLEYRRIKEQSSQHVNETEPKPVEKADDSANETEAKSDEVNHVHLRFYDYLAIDLLNCYPLRKWRNFHAAFPIQCWTVTLCIWLTGQILFAKLEFGLVYFIASLFLLMFLNLGVRKEGEMSAYSVFNPNCERLLGQITSEHFERDVLQRNHVSEND